MSPVFELLTSINTAVIMNMPTEAVLLIRILLMKCLVLRVCEDASGK